MPYAFAFIGIILIVAGINGKLSDMVAILKSDLVGQSSFIYWMVAIFAIGAIGTFKPLKPVSTGFLVLIVLVLILANSKNGQGFFVQLKSQLDQIAQGTGSSVSTTPDTSSNGGLTLPTLPSFQSILGSLGSSTGSTIPSR